MRMVCADLRFAEASARRVFSCLPAGRSPGSFAVFERCGLAACFFCGGRGLVRAVRIELTTQHWKCRILPLNYARINLKHTIGTALEKIFLPLLLLQSRLANLNQSRNNRIFLLSCTVS